jgi:hypothetical protein
LYVCVLCKLLLRTHFWGLSGHMLGKGKYGNFYPSNLIRASLPPLPSFFRGIHQKVVIYVGYIIQTKDVGQSGEKVLYVDCSHNHWWRIIKSVTKPHRNSD